jgi:UDP-glucose 4-epimerase
MNILDGSKVLITGGTGSLGQELTRRLLSGRDGIPDSITIYSRDELKQSEMKTAMPSKKLKFVIGDVRDRDRVELALQGIDIIFNAAAMKRVETCQRFPSESIKTNLIGTINIVETIQKYRLPVHTVIGVSSDKGCHPVNIYGSTKFLQEQILLAANQDIPGTRFIAVCYGNVLASRGSVIPIFQEQITSGGPVTVRDPEMTRFLISLDQAVDTLMAALYYAQPGEIYIPIIPSATVGDIASVLINGRDIKIKVTGRGVGEKMDETLITSEDAPRVVLSNGYYVVTGKIQPRMVLETEYNSRDYLLSRGELKKLFISKGYIKGEVSVK